MSATVLSTDTSLEIKRFFTVERALYGLFFAAGVGLRFYGLGAAPLTPAEALQSWPIWQAAQGMPAPAVEPSASAFLSSLQLLAFWLTPGGDAVARFASAFFGSLLLVTPWLLRPWLGRTTALALALLFAVDPWLVAFSRMADGAILATTLALFALTFLARISLPASTPVQRSRWLYAAAGATGLLLVSGPLAWCYAPLLILFGLLLVRPALSEEELRDLRAGRNGALLTLGGAALLGGSTWLARPAGLASVGHSFGDWLGHLRDGAYPLSWSVARVIADQPFNLVFGAVGLALLWRERDRLPMPAGSRWPLFLTLWLGWGILGQLLPGRRPEGLLVLGLPLLFGAAYGVSRLVARTPRPLDWRETAFALITLAVLLVAGRFAANALLASVSFDLNLALIVLLIGIGMLLAIILFAVWTSWSRALWLGGVFLAGWLLLATLGDTWQLAHVHDAQRPNGLTAVSGHPTVRTLAADLRTLSAQRDGDATAKPVQVQMASAPDPLLGWYLRDRRMVEWVLAPSLELTGMTPLVITLGAGIGAGEPSEQSSAPAGYIGSNYDLRYDWLPSELLTRPIPELAAPPEGNVGARIEARLDGIWRARLQPFLRWALHHKVDNVPAGDGIRLWVMAEE